MSFMTQNIRSKLMENMTDQESLLNIEDVYTVGMRCIFDHANESLAFIDQAKRKFFVQTFLQHFMLDEIGLETWGLWKVQLNTELLENASLVNQLMDNMDKAIYSRYNVRRVEKDSEHELTKNTSESNSATDAETGTSANLTNETNSNQRDSSLSSRVEDTGTVENEKSGSDTNRLSGNDVVSLTGSDEVAASGSDHKVVNDDVSETHTGGNTTTTSDSSSESSEDESSEKNNSIKIVYDTPQGSLNNMRSPGGDATGTGVAYVNGQTYNYMSGADEDDSTSVKAGESSSSSSSSGTSEIEYDESNSSERDMDDVTSYGRVDTTTYGKIDTTQYGKVDTQTYGSENVETRDLLNVKNETGSIEDSGSRAVQEQGTTSKSNNHSGESESEASESGNGHDEEQEINYEITNEMLINAHSIMKQTMQLFDGLFSQMLYADRM